MGFTIKDILHNKATTLLHLETEPGLGCTEPAAIGFCASAAASLLRDVRPDSIEITTDPSLYKNAMGVIIPASGGGCGIPLAAAMGVTAGDPKLGLQVFATMDAPGLERARALVADGKVSAGIKKGHKGLFVKTAVRAAGHTAVAVVSGRHDHLDSLSLDGEPRKDHPLLGGGAEGEGNVEELEGWLRSLSLGDMMDLLDDLDSDDLSYIRQGIDLNRELAEYGLVHGPGIAVGKTQQSLIRQGILKKDMVLWAGIMAAAGIDSRMGGVMLPAMTLAGSGNQGIASSTPIMAAAEFAVMEDPDLPVRAVTLSYLVTCFIKVGVGRLSALCSSGVAGGAGVGAGVAYLLGGDVEKIGGAVKNHIESFATVICDGAKTGCALKVGEAVSSGVKSALLALQGTVVKPVDGIIDTSPEDTMRHVGRLSHEGMSSMDPVILDIMLKKSP